MTRLAWTSLRARAATAVGALVALALAAAVVCACGVLLETGLRGEVAPGRLAGVPVVVTADQQIHWVRTEHKHGKTKRKVKSKDLAERAWLPASVGARLAAVPGAQVVGDRVFPVALFRPGGTTLIRTGGLPVSGHDWSAARLTPYRLVAGRAPGSDGDVVLDTTLAAAAGVRVGDRIGVQATRSPSEYTVSGIARPRTPVTQESAVFFAPGEAAGLAGRGDSVAYYGVFGAGADAVRAALRGTRAQVITGDARGAAALPGIGAARTQLVSTSAAIGGTTLVVAVLVVVATFSLSVQHRHRELALLRTIGATPRQVRRLVGREALLLGVLAAAPGALAGLPLASLLRREFVSRHAVPDALGLVRSPFPVIAAAAATVLAALVAARVSARRVARIRPVEALAEAGVERRAVGRGRTAAGGVAVTGALAVSLLLTVLHTEPAALPVTYLCVLLWMIAVALLGPHLARGGALALSPVWRTSRVGGHLAGHMTRQYSRRTAEVVTPLALLLAMTATIWFVPATLGAAVAAQTRDGLHAERVVVSGGPGVPASAVAALRSTPGVSAAVAVVQSTIWIGDDRRTARGLGGPGLTRVLDPDVASGSLTRLGPDTIALSTRAAQGRRPGAEVRVTLGDGTAATLRLVAVYRRELGFGDVLLGFDRLVRHVDSPLASQVLVLGRAGAGTLAAALSGCPGVRSIGIGTFERALADGRDTGTAAEQVLLALVVAFCGVAVFTTLASAVGRRSTEFALLRLTGATQRQVRSMVRWELAIVVVLAAAVAAGASWAALAGFSIGMTGGSTPVIDPVTCGALVLAAGALGAAALALPVRTLVRRDPVGEVAGPQ